MASFVPNNWKGHLGISVGELFLKNALGLLINNRSNFREERIIVRKFAATFREEQIIARKFGVNHRAKRISIQKIARIKTTGVTKMRGNFVKISFQVKFLRKATNQEFRRNSFALLLHNTVSWQVISFPHNANEEKIFVTITNHSSQVKFIVMFSSCTCTIGKLRKIWEREMVNTKNKSRDRNTCMP